jgi:DNA mismatch repair protein MutS2
MPAPILERARKLTGENQLQLQEFQALLQRRIQELEAKEANFVIERKEWEAGALEQQKQVQHAGRKLEQELSRLRESNADLLRTLNAKVEAFLSRSRVAQDRRHLQKQFQEEVVPVMEQLEEITGMPPAAPLSSLQVGDRVWVSLYKEFGEISSIKKDLVEVIIRNKRFQVPPAMIEKKASLTETLPRGVQVNVSEKQVEPELNLIGLSVEEALSATDKYLDDAFLSQLPEVRLIHGHGTGKLRKAIQEMLSAHPHVRGFHSESARRQRRDRGGIENTLVRYAGNYFLVR